MMVEWFGTSNCKSEFRSYTQTIFRNDCSTVLWEKDTWNLSRLHGGDWLWPEFSITTFVWSPSSPPRKYEQMADRGPLPSMGIWCINCGERLPNSWAEMGLERLERSLVAVFSRSQRVLENQIFHRPYPIEISLKTNSHEPPNTWK